MRSLQSWRDICSRRGIVVDASADVAAWHLRLSSSKSASFAAAGARTRHARAPSHNHVVRITPHDHTSRRSLASSSWEWVDQLKCPGSVWQPREGLDWPQVWAMQKQPFSYFGFLGSEVAFDVDFETVESVYKQLQRNLHPDKLAHHKNEREKGNRIELGTWLNNALDVLRDPARRALYMLEQFGYPLGEHEDQQELLDADFLMEVMELRERIDELVESGNQDQIRSVLDDVERMKRVCTGNLSALFASLLARQNASPHVALNMSAPEELRSARCEAARLQYIRRMEMLLRDVADHF